MAKKKATNTIARRPGVKRGRKPAKSAEAPPINELPDPPDYLGDEARRFYLTIGPLLVQAKILTVGHLPAFSMICETWEEYRQLAELLRDKPELRYQTFESGARQQSPELIDRNKAAEQLQKLWSNFGLTPKALGALGKLSGTGGSLPSIVLFANQKYDDLED